MVKKMLSVYYIVPIIVFVAGLTNLLTSLSLHHMPHIKLFEGIIPLYFKHTARTFALLTGIFLMVLSFNLFRRKRRAWILSLFLILSSIFLQLVRGFNILELVFLASLLILLLTTRHAFEIESDKNKAVYGVIRFFTVLTLLFFYAFFGFYLFQGQFSHHVNIQNIITDYMYSIAGIGQEVLIPTTKNALWFTDSITIISVVLFLFSLLQLFEPLIEINKMTSDEQEKIRKLVLGSGTNSVQYFSLTKEKQHFFDAERNINLSYVIKNGFAIVLGDPIGVDHENFILHCQRFISENEKKDIKTLFYNTSEKEQALYTSLGYKSIKIGEEALLRTDTFNLIGSSMANVRHEVTKIQRERGIFLWFTMDKIPWKYIDEINKLHEFWTSQKKAPQLTFSLDFFPFPIEENAYVLVITGQNGVVWGTLSFFPYDNNRAMALDFMIRSSQAPHGVIEAGINEAVTFFKTKGVLTVSLGMAPLSDITIQKNNNISQKIKNIVFDRFNQFYQYKSLFKFKNKFNPVWTHKYLIYKRDVDLPAIMIALAQAHLKKQLTLLSLFK